MSTSFDDVPEKFDTIQVCFDQNKTGL